MQIDTEVPNEKTVASGKKIEVKLNNQSLRVYPITLN